MPSTFFMDISGAYGGATQYGSWTITSPVTRYKLSSTKVDTGLATVSYLTGSNSTLRSILMGQFWSPPLRGEATLTGSFNFTLRGWEYNAGANLYPAVSVTVRSGDGSTVRGAMWGSFLRRSIEYTVNLATTKCGTGTTSGSIGIASGDRIVIELGYSGDPSTNVYHNGWQVYGCSSTYSDHDLANNDAGDKNPWFSFSGDFPLLTDPWTGNATSFLTQAFSVGRDIIAAPAATFFRTMSHAIQSVLSAYRSFTYARNATRSIAGGTLIYVSDSFDRANEQPLASPWFGVQYGANILLLGSHCVRGTTMSHGDSMVGYSGTFSDNQYAQFTYVRNTGYDCGPIVLGNPGGSAYVFDYYDSAWHVIKFTGVGVYSEQFSKTDVGAGPNNGDVMKLELSGSKFTCYKNAAIVATGYATSPKLTGGAPGIYMYTMMGTVNDFSGGDLSSSGAGGGNSFLASRARSFNRLLSWAIAPTRQLSRIGWRKRAVRHEPGKVALFTDDFNRADGLVGTDWTTTDDTQSSGTITNGKLGQHLSPGKWVLCGSSQFGSTLYDQQVEFTYGGGGSFTQWDAGTGGHLNIWGMLRYNYKSGEAGSAYTVTFEKNETTGSWACGIFYFDNWTAREGYWIDRGPSYPIFVEGDKVRYQVADNSGGTPVVSVFVNDRVLATKEFVSYQHKNPGRAGMIMYYGLLNDFQVGSIYQYNKPTASRLRWLNKRSLSKVGATQFPIIDDNFNRADFGSNYLIFGPWRTKLENNMLVPENQGTYGNLTHDFKNGYDCFTEMTLATTYNGSYWVYQGCHGNLSTYFYTYYTQESNGVVVITTDPWRYSTAHVTGPLDIGDRLRTECRLINGTMHIQTFVNGVPKVGAIDPAAPTATGYPWVGLLWGGVDDWVVGTMPSITPTATVSRLGWLSRRVEPSNWYNVTFTDDFNRADGTLSSPWDNWTEWQIAGSRLGQGTWEFEGARIDSVVGSNTFLSCDFSEKTSLGAYSFVLGLRYQLGGANYYSFGFADTLCEIGGQTNSTFYVVQQFPVSSVGTLEPGDRVRVSAYNLDDGNVLLQAHKNGALWLSSVDSSENKKTGTGYPWVAVYHGYIDNVSAGDTGLSSPSFSVARVVTGIGVLYRNLVSYISENFSLSRSAWYKRYNTYTRAQSDSASRLGWYKKTATRIIPGAGAVATSSDNFNRADETPIALTNWGSIANAGLINLTASCAKSVTSNTDKMIYYKADSVGSNQWSQYTFATAGDGGPGVRGTLVSGVGSMYFLDYFDAAWHIYRYRASAVQVGVGSVTTGPVAGNVARLEIVGSVLTGFLDGVPTVVASDATQLSDGYPGIHMYDNGMAADNWSGGTLSSSSGGGNNSFLVSRSKSFLRTLLHSVQGSRTVSRLTRRLRSAVTQVAGTRTVQRVGTYLKSIRTDIVRSSSVSRLTRRVRTAARDAVVAASVARRALYERTVSLVRGATSVVGRLTQGTGLFVRTIAEAISTSPAVSRFGYWSRRVSTTVSRAISVLAQRGVIYRAIASTIARSASVVRRQYWVRSVADAVSRSISVARMGYFLRRISTARAGVLSVGRSLGAVLRNVAHQIAATAVVSRSQRLLRSAALTVRTTLSVRRVAQFLRTIRTNLVRASVASRIKTAVRRVTTSVVGTTSVAYSWYLRRRSAVASIVRTSVLNRLGTVARSAALSLARTMAVSRRRGLIRNVTRAFSGAFTVNRKQSYVRAVELSEAVSSYASRFRPLIARTVGSVVGSRFTVAVNARLFAVIYAVKTVIQRLMVLYMQSGQATTTKTTVQKIEDIK